MSLTMDELAQKFDALRADLAATNLALLSISNVLTPEQRQAVLATMAKSSAEKQALCERIPIAKMRAAVQLQQAAEERLYQALQGAKPYLG